MTEYYQQKVNPNKGSKNKCNNNYNGRKRDYTFKPGGDNVKKIFNRIDYILATRDVLENFGRCYHKTLGMTDHKAVVLRSGTRDPREERPKGLWRHNDLISYDEEFLEAVANAAKEAEASGLDSQMRWEYLKFKIREISRRISIERAGKRRKEKKALQEKIDSMNPCQDSKEIAECQVQLDKILAKEMDTLRLLAGVQNAEEGEKSTAFFYASIKRRKDQTNINKLSIQGAITEEKNVIDAELFRFYEELYRERERTNERNWYAEVPSLTQEQRNRVNRRLSKAECQKAIIKTMKTGKSPGNDGLTVACLRALWSTSGDMIMESFNQAFIKGKMAASQRQSVIRLIPKKDKSTMELKNWRPISLMSTDTKILAKSLAERLKEILPTLISEEQHAFISNQ